jgi:hypothetical protein
MGNAIGQCFGFGISTHADPSPGDREVLISPQSVCSSASTTSNEPETSREASSTAVVLPSSDLLSVMECPWFSTSHHNWAWVVDETIQEIAPSGAKGQILKKQSELPSQQGQAKEKPCYALFKVETVVGHAGVDSRSVWATSKCLGFLDSKDSLYRGLQKAGKQSLMPPTELINWDAKTVADVGDFPTTPALLKAALGSGGFGLYFVTEKHHALSIVQAHATRAQQFDGFLEGLRRDHDGMVPSWSLQALVQPRRLSSGRRRCQVRAYVVVCERPGCGVQLYCYRDLEVRMPSWDIDLDATINAPAVSAPVLPETEGKLQQDFITGQTLSVAEFEEYCCANGVGRPYNKDRNKTETDRLMLDEVPELVPLKGALTANVREAMVALQPAIMNYCSSPGIDNKSRTQMAIAGLDLLVDESGQAYLIEINNNPAMPQATKKMSPLYRSHLITMAGNMIKLGLVYGVGQEDDASFLGFERLW